MSIVVSDALSAFPVKTGLLSGQLAEKKGSMGFAAKAVQLEKRRRQRQMRKGLVRHSLKRKLKIAKKSVNKRRITLMKANRKRRRTMRVIRRKRR